MTKKGTILLIEDDQNLTFGIKTALEYEGFLGIACSHIFDITNILSRTNPDLVLCDYWLKEESIQSILNFIKNKHPNPIPFVLMSGDPGIKKISSDLNIPFFIKKPFDSDELFSIINLALDFYKRSDFSLLNAVN